MKLTEDDIYRMSTQYKHWSFTPEQLAAQRLKTNIQASERVKANVARLRAERARQSENASASESERNGAGGESGSNTPIPGDKEVNCLTVAEEMKLVDVFCAISKVLDPPRVGRRTFDSGQVVPQSPEARDQGVVRHALALLPPQPPPVCRPKIAESVYSIW